MNILSIYKMAWNLNFCLTQIFVQLNIRTRIVGGQWRHKISIHENELFSLYPYMANTWRHKPPAFHARILGYKLKGHILFWHLRYIVQLHCPKQIQIIVYIIRFLVDNCSHADHRVNPTLWKCIVWVAVFEEFALSGQKMH